MKRRITGGRINRMKDEEEKKIEHGQIFGHLPRDMMGEYEFLLDGRVGDE